jgi:hypothetical protein
LNDLGPLPEPTTSTPEPKKRGRPVKKAAPDSVGTSCRIRMRLTIKKGEKMYAILVNTKVKSPKAIREAFEKWSAQVDKVWAKL